MYELKQTGLYKIAVGVCALSLLSACGGGGGTAVPVASPTVSQPAAPPPPPPPDPNTTAADFRTAEYQRAGSLDIINAADAYALGATGENVTIGVVDFNFDFASDEVAYSSRSRGANEALRDIYEAQIGESTSTDQHGHAVAVVAAGTRDDRETHGVAFDANVIAVDFFSGVNSQQVRDSGIDYTISDPWTYLVQNGARVINKSFGFDEGGIIENPPDVDRRYILDFETNAVVGGALLVASAGNNQGLEPSLSNLRTIERLDELGLLDAGPGAFIIAGAINPDGTIASFSDRAGDGIEQNFYLVAPGVDITLPWNGELVSASGTSFSAPHITGAAALLFDIWPSLTAREVATILFDTATDLGAPGTDNIYGRGLINVAAALQPIGSSSIAVAPSGNQTAPSQPVSSAATAVNTNGLLLGSAFGDASGIRQGLTSVTILDSFNRDFQLDLSGNAVSSPTNIPLNRLIEDRRNWQSSHLNFAKNAGVTYAVNIDQQRELQLLVGGQQARDLAPSIAATFEFAGQYLGTEWRLGSGQSLQNALTNATDIRGAASVRAVSVTGASNLSLNRTETTYGISTLPIGDQLTLSIGAGFGSYEAIDNAAFTDLQNDSALFTGAARMTRHGGWFNVSAEIGFMREENAILGTRSTGALQITEEARTGWLGLEANAFLHPGLSLHLAATLGTTHSDNNGTSIFSNSGTILTNGFSASLAKTGLFEDRDLISLSVSQPLRVEDGSIALTTATGRDAISNDLIFEARQFTLSPSGREIAIETAYRATFGRWQTEANIAYRFDADHVAGRRDAILYLGLFRRF